MRYLYQLEKGRAAKGEPPHVVYHAGEQSLGFGNRIRNLMTALLLALATDRLLVVDNAAVLDHFDDPALSQGFALFNSPEREEEMASIFNRSRKEVHGKSQDIHTLKTYVGSLDDYFSNADIVHISSGWEFDESVFENKLYKEKLVTLFEGSAFFVDVSDKMLSWLFQKPNQGLLDATCELWEYIGAQTVGNLYGVQIRIFVDMPGYQQKYEAQVEEFWDVANKGLRYMMNEAGVDSDQVGFFLTSDAPHMIPHFEERLRLFGRVLVDNRTRSYHHTTGVPRGIVMPIVHWYLLGQLDYVLCTGTSYCSSSRALRLGGLHRTWKSSVMAPILNGAFQWGDTYDDHNNAEMNKYLMI